jgi:hypothetical protein
MAAKTAGPALDEELLDELARIYMLAALEELLQELETTQQHDRHRENSGSH